MVSLSKEMFFEAMLMMRNLEVISIGSLGTIVPIIAWIASIFTFVYSMIIVFQTFFGDHINRIGWIGKHMKLQWEC